MSFYYRAKPVIPCVLVLFLLVCILPAQAQERPALSGNWIVNAELSDNTDKKVERVLRNMGQKVNRCWLRCEEDRYRGGPKEQEVYDRLSYDKTLSIELIEPTYRFTYEDNYQRPVYTDGRSQSVSLNRLETVEDFSFAHWEDNQLLVEARPRDGGFANETYSLIDGGTRLKADLYILPAAFSEPIELVRIYDRIVNAVAP